MSNGGDDKDKTVIGGALPGFPGGPGTPNPIPSPGQRPGSPNQATVIGGPLPTGGFGGSGMGGSDSDAWATGGDFGRTAGSGGGFGGGAPAQPGGFGGGFGAPAPQDPFAVGGSPGGFGARAPSGPAFAAPPSAIPPGQAAHTPFGQSNSFFPDPAVPQAQQQAPMAPVRKIDLQLALKGTGLGKGGPGNPILAAAANLLILFGRLRTQMVDMEARPLMEHVTREMELFEQNVLSAGIAPHEAQVAKYMLSGTADDIVQNIPGTDKHLWMQYSMVARFFNVRTSGVGFFQELEKALVAPAQQFRILELALVCLSLGFEGQYRTMPNGQQELHRIRSMVYDSLRRVQPRPDGDFSPRWQPVVLGRRRKFGGTPVWVVAGAVGVLMLAGYVTFSMLLVNDGSRVVSRFLAVNPSDSITLQRSVAVFTPVEPEPPEPVGTQFDRITERLTAEIEEKIVDLGAKGEFIVVRINNAALFDSGKADVKDSFAEIGARIAEALDPEPGPIKVQGFTDNIPMSGRGRFKNNFELSLARATSVKDVLARKFTDSTRLEVEGRGEADPIADNATPDGRALNRRVEILLLREEAVQ